MLCDKAKNFTQNTMFWSQHFDMLLPKQCCSCLMPACVSAFRGGHISKDVTLAGCLYCWHCDNGGLGSFAGGHSDLRTLVPLPFLVICFPESLNFGFGRTLVNVHHWRQFSLASASCSNTNPSNRPGVFPWSSSI